MAQTRKPVAKATNPKAPRRSASKEELAQRYLGWLIFERRILAQEIEAVCPEGGIYTMEDRTINRFFWPVDSRRKVTKPTARARRVLEAAGVPIDHDPDHWYFGKEGHMHHPVQVAMRGARRRGERRSAAKPADEILLEAEREIARLVALPDVGGNIPAERCHAWSDRRSFIISTKAVGLIGAAVKLRQLIHPDLGIGDSCPDDVALARDALAVIDRMIATS